MADIKYGSSGEGFQDAIARMNAQEQALTNQEKAEKRLSDAEQSGSRARGANAKARADATSVIEAQVEAINAAAAAVERETGLLAANTSAWKLNATARAGSLGSAAEQAAARKAGPVEAVPVGATGAKGATTVGFSDTIANIDRKLAAQEAAGAAAAQRILQGSQRLDPRLTPREPLPQLPPPNQRLLPPGAPLYERFPPGTYLGRGYDPREGAGALAAGGVGARTGAAGGGPSFVGGPGGISEQSTRTIYGETAAIGAYTTAEKDAIATNRAFQASIAGVADEQVAANAAFRLAAAEQASASQALTRHGALSSEFIQSFVRGEATLKEFGNALTQTIGKFAGWAVAGGLVYGAFEALKRVAQGAQATASGVEQLERALPGKVNRKEAEEGFRHAAVAINVPIRSAADAQFFAARAGFGNQRESLKAGEIALEAHKLDEVPIQDATRGLGALHIAFGLNADQINRVFHELNTGQLEFNARLSQTLPQLGRAASAVASAGGNVQEFVAQLVATIGVTGGGGGQGGGTPATLFIREPSNVVKPNSAAILSREGFDPQEALKDLTAFNRKLGERVRNLPASAVREGESRAEAQARVTREFAFAIGGGSSIGNRYGLGLINAASSGRLAAIEKADRETPSGGRAEDLGKKINQFDEQLVQIGVKFEAIGNEIGRSGVTAAAEGFLSVLHLTADATELAAKPLLTLGQAISSIPGPVQTLIAALATGVGINRLAKSDKAIGLSRAAGEIPGLGFLDSEEKVGLRDARRTTAANLQAQKNAVERSAAANQAAAAAAEDAVRAKTRYAASPENAERARLVRERPDSREALEATAVGEKYDSDIKSSRNKLTATQDRLLNDRARQLGFETDEEILGNRQLSVRQRLVAINERNAVLAQAGVATNQALLAGSAPVGTAYRARGGAAAEGALAGAGEADFYRKAAGRPPAAGTLDDSARASALRQEQDFYSRAAAGAGATATSLEGGSVEIKSAFNLAVEQLVAGGVEIGAACKLAARQILSGSLPTGKGFAGGAKDVAGGIFGAAGAGFSAIGKNLLKGFFAAYIGSAIAEIVGSAVGGKAGSTISSIGGDTAIGAGIGTVVPVIGPEIGAVAGFGYGAGKALAGLVNGSYTPEEEKKILEQRQQTYQRNREHLETPAVQLGVKPGTYPALEKAIEDKPGKEQAARRERIEQAAALFGRELETAFKDESDGAKKALKYVETSITNSAAQLKLYGKSAPGKEAAGTLKADIEKELEQLGRHPATTSQTVAALEKSLGIGVAQTKTDFTKALGTAQTPAQVRQALERARQSAGGYKQTIPNQLNRFQEEYNNAQAGVTNIQKELSKAEAEPATRGNEGKATAIKARLKSAQESVESWSRVLANFKNAIPGLEAAFNELENQAGEAYRAQVQKNASGDARKLAEAGPDPAAKAKVEREIRQRNENFAKKTYKGKLPKEKEEERDLHNENVKAATEQAQNVQQERVAQIDRTTSLELSKLPAGAPSSAAAAIRAKGAAAKLAVIKSNKEHSFTSAQLTEAETSVNEANKAREEGVSSDASAIVSARGSLRQAQDAGNSVAQAKDAQATAGELLGLAKTTAERISAMAQVISAANQLQQALQQRTQSIGELKESTELNPLEKDKTHLQTLRKQYRNAKGPDEKRQRQKEINEALTKRNEDRVSEFQDELKFLETTEQIVPQQAAERIRQFLKEHKRLSKKVRRQLEAEAFQDEHQQSGADFGITGIKLPTLYDVRRAAQVGTRTLGDISHNFAPTYEQNVNVTMYVTGADAKDIAKRTVEGLHGTLRKSTRKHLRSAGRV